MKDNTLLEEEALFTDGTTIQELIYELEDATIRKKCRKEQNKVREYLIITSFRVQLKAPRKWYRWVMEIESNLKIIVGEQGIPLS